MLLHSAMGKLWLKLEPWARAGTVLCSYKVDHDFGHRCLLTDDEGPAATPAFGKFRWILNPVEGASAYIISNAEFGGRLYVSDCTFQSKEMTVASVYVRPPGHPIDPREVWYMETLGNDLCRVVSMFNGQVLCQTDVVANAKGDRWVGVVDESVADPHACTFVMRLLRVGS